MEATGQLTVPGREHRHRDFAAPDLHTDVVGQPVTGLHALAVQKAMHVHKGHVLKMQPAKALLRVDSPAVYEHVGRLPVCHTNQAPLVQLHPS